MGVDNYFNDFGIFIPWRGKRKRMLDVMGCVRVYLGDFTLLKASLCMYMYMHVYEQSLV